MKNTTDYIKEKTPTRNKFYILGVRDGKLEATKESNEVLRSAYQIAARRGKMTSWETWIKCLDKILREQYKIMYPASLSPQKGGQDE